MGFRKSILPLLPWALFAAALFSGCGGSLEGPAYLDWVENHANGLRQTQTVQGHVFELQYEPAPYRVMRNARTVELDEATLAKGAEEMSGFEHFRLTIARQDGGPVLAATHLPGQIGEERKHYFAFGAEKDLKLVVNGAELPTAFYHFEDQMGMKPGITLVFAFPAPAEGQSMTVQFHDQQLTGETIRFEYSPEILENIPALKSKKI
jgi:hypothetical protein